MLLLPPPPDRPDARPTVAPEDDIVVIPAPGVPPERIRPPAETLVERLRRMQMQGWS
jgi:hypothetical protein